MNRRKLKMFKFPQSGGGEEREEPREREKTKINRAK